MYGNGFVRSSEVSSLNVFHMLLWRGPGGCHRDGGRQRDLGVRRTLFVRILTRKPVCKCAFFGSLSRLSLLVIIHLPFPPAFSLICRIFVSLSLSHALSLALSQALRSHKSSFPPLDWKSDLQSILKEFLALLAKLRQRKNTDSGHEKDTTQKEPLLPPTAPKEYFLIQLRLGCNCSRLGKCPPDLICVMPHAWCSLFDLSELLMPSLDERLDLPAHGSMLSKGNC